MLSYSNEVLWQDREVRFDAPRCDLVFKNGEVNFKLLENIEDVKGNNGDKGDLYVTNLRLLWISNLCRINYMLLLTLLKLLASAASQIFVLRIKQLEKAWRLPNPKGHMILREFIEMKGNLLMLLPLESLFDEIDGVWNLSSDQGNLGKLFVTNFRLVWTSIINGNFNISIPFLKSKFGEALVIQTTRQAGSYLLGFRIDPRERLNKVAKQLGSLHSIYWKNPVLGITTGQAKDEAIQNVCKYGMNIYIYIYIYIYTLKGEVTSLKVRPPNALVRPRVGRVRSPSRNALTRPRVYSLC
ncbi:unnamed protein product [Schistosoma margrebowiei]|uniref:BBSome complex member BBS5 PH domain-containing protein n=1 Tax=Schistosoma margrebowiei TaxID=48269 RepID=A0A183MQE7_9TREM|nr:unnamed protein product [Schistosoma margrebowiei]